MMKKQWIAFLVLSVALFPALSQAAQFSVVGPRALGMGGASVAAVNDSTAVYWNPAALADTRHVDVRVPAEAALHDHVGLKDTWTKINDIDALVQAHDPAAINEAISLLQGLNKPNTGADVDASAGLLAAIPLSKSTLAISALGLGYAGLYPTIDTQHLGTDFLQPTTFVGNNDSSVTGAGIWATEPAVSFATPIGDSFFIGANAKMIYAKTYSNTQLLRSNTFNTFVDDLRKSEATSTAASLDAGLLYVPIESFRVGLVGRDLNSPSFPFAGSTLLGSTGTGEIKFDPQYRAGVEWRPLKTLAVSADYDLSKNKTLIPGYEDRTAAVGLEKTFFSEYLSVRLGASRNTADSSAKTVYAGGLGFRLFAFRVDLAYAQDPGKREMQASLDLALRF